MAVFGRYVPGFAQDQDATLGWSDDLAEESGKLNVVTTVAPIFASPKAVAKSSYFPNRNAG